MSKVIAIMSMSLDGYVAGADDGVAEVFDWYFTSGDVEIHTGGRGGELCLDETFTRGGADDVSTGSAPPDNGGHPTRNRAALNIKGSGGRVTPGVRLLLAADAGS